jgi:hypothetical protein
MVQFKYCKLEYSLISHEPYSWLAGWCLKGSEAPNLYCTVVARPSSDGCGVEVTYRADGKLQSMDRSKGATSMVLISLLLYADDVGEQ